MKKNKYLIIRFSSLGDFLQSLSIAGRIGLDDPGSEIHFLTRSDMEEMAVHHPKIDRVWTISKGAKAGVLLELAFKLRAEDFTHIYDAHNNLRSKIVSVICNGPFFLQKFGVGHKFLRRSIQRFKRFFLFNFRINFFEKPFSGQKNLLRPLGKWKLQIELPPVPQLYFEKKPYEELDAAVAEFQATGGFVALAPSASYALKRWPLEKWIDLIKKWEDVNFCVFGGPEDKFLGEIQKVAPGRVKNFVGKIKFIESAYIVSKSKLVISNDTGLMHVAEQRGIPCIALMGPAPFGFPSRPLTKIVEKELSCRPCSKHGQGPCTNKEFQKCMMDIQVAEIIDLGRGLRGEG